MTIIVAWISIDDITDTKRRENHSMAHDIFEDAEERYDMLRQEDANRLSFNIEIFNKITRGGILKKTLHVFLADSDKTTFMTNFTAHTLQQDKNVVYFTLGSTKEDIAKSLKANILNTPISELHDIDEANYDEEMEAIQNTTGGEIIIKEYPAKHTHCSDFRAFLGGLKMKRNSPPDLIIVDCLDDCASQRNKNKENSEEYMQSVTMEIHGMAMEYNLAVLSAARLSRDGFPISDPRLDDTPESYGISAMCDVMWALTPNETLESENHILVKHMKNRYHDTDYYKKFIIKIDRDKMQFSDAEQTARKNIPDVGYDDDD